MHLAPNGRALVRVTKSFRAYPEGTIAGFDPQIAQDLVAKGFAQFHYPTPAELAGIPKPRNLPVDGYRFVTTPTSRPAGEQIDEDLDGLEEAAGEADDLKMDAAGDLEIPADWREQHHTRRMKWAAEIVGRPVSTAAKADEILAAEVARREKPGQVLS